MAAPPPLKKPERGDWIGWAMVAVGGGSAPSAINLAIESAPPAVIAAFRIWAAAVLLLVYTYATGRRLVMPTSPAGLELWLYAAAAGFVGYAMPFFLFPYAQLQVSSIMAGIVMAFLPVMAVVFAALFAGEPMTKRSLGGVLVGSLGVLFLLGPAVFGGISGTALGILLLLLAVLGYAVMGVIMRRAPDHPARSFATMMMLAAAVMATPFAVGAELEGISAASWSAILFLGLVPTGINAIVIVTVVRRAGAGFLATSAYASPVIAVFFGISFFGEPLAATQILGLLTILAGVALTQSGGHKTAPASSQAGITAAEEKTPGGPNSKEQAAPHGQHGLPPKDHPAIR
ncbi:DMT family transporter [Parvularcula maris]|uniref:DMT family transporter n=1 Tax=Parvularcula maris TaxID=2965077 RepID=A0A9X2LBC6_9PROT|nr:DMT family transporter [Parvularcula maris]MCQ8185407.1 DMT family transporter [Parvularcula maris]